MESESLFDAVEAVYKLRKIVAKPVTLPDGVDKLLMLLFECPNKGGIYGPVHLTLCTAAQKIREAADNT